MDRFEHENTMLKAENLQLQDELDLLKRDIERLLKSKKVLKEFIKKNKIIWDKFSRQGFKYDEFGWGWHYLVFPVEGIPGSLDIRDVKQIIDELLAPYLAEKGEYAGYTISSINFSERGSKWYVQIGKLIDATKVSELPIESMKFEN